MDTGHSEASSRSGSQLASATSRRLSSSGTLLRPGPGTEAASTENLRRVSVK